MKKETISFILYTVLALSCAACSSVFNDTFIRSTFAFCTVGWGMCSGMTLNELLTRDK